MRNNPKAGAEKIEEWTKIDKEVVYIFLGPGGIHTLDPTIKPCWIEPIKRQLRDAAEAQHDQAARYRCLGQRQLRAAGLQGTRARLRQAAGSRSIPTTSRARTRSARRRSTTPKEAGEIWIKGGDIVPFSSPVCTLRGVKKYTAEGKKFNAVYLVDHDAGHQGVRRQGLLRGQAGDPKKPEIVPFLLKKDAEAHAAKTGGKVATYAEALAPSTSAARKNRWAAWRR